MADESEPMHQEFARWYSAVSMGNDAAHLQARWDGVTTVISDAERTTTEALLRVAYGTRAAPDAPTLQAIRQAFRDADGTFPMGGNDRELQVLAGICLAVLMENLDEHEGSAAALAVTTSALGGAREPELPMKLADLGEAAISRRANLSRERPALSAYTSAQPPKVDFEKAIAKFEGQQDWAGVAEALKVAAASTQSAVRLLAQRQASAIEAIDDFIRVQDEELQMLWWLTGRRSETYNCAFSAVVGEAQPFVFARELAGCTEFLPGPASANAILSRAGLTERELVPISAAVNAPEPAWLQAIVGDIDPSPVSTPLHFAIKRQLETGRGDAWIAGWAATSGIDAAHALPSLTLGELFYRERLLVQFG